MTFQDLSSSCRQFRDDGFARIPHSGVLYVFRCAQVPPQCENQRKTLGTPSESQTTGTRCPKTCSFVRRQSMSMPRHSCSMCSRPSWVKTVDMHRASGSVYKQWARLMRDQGARQTSAQLGKDGLHVTMSRNVTNGVLSPLHNVTVHNVSNACPGRWQVAGMTAQNLSPHLASRSSRGNIPWAPAARSP